MLTNHDAQQIADLFYTIDMSVRDDLFKDRIADERDYVSRLVTCFTYPFGILNKYRFNGVQFKSQWFARVNSGHQERIFGCDSMIVFKVEDKIKVGLFESKWPRILLDPDYPWDYTQKNSKKSHFTDQIERQSLWTNYAAIWEMFFYEQEVGVFNKPFDKYASTCIQHQFAKDLINKTPSLQTIWNNDDLTRLIQSEQSPAFDGSNETNLLKVIFNILTCKYGRIIPIKPADRAFIIPSNDDERKERCPILSMTEVSENAQIIESFMKEHGLSFFQQLDIS